MKPEAGCQFGRIELTPKGKKQVEELSHVIGINITLLDGSRWNCTRGTWVAIGIEAGEKA